MDYTASVHVCRGRAMYEALCIDEDLGNIVMGNDEKMRFKELEPFI